MTDLTYAEEQARAATNPNTTAYHVFIDGQQVVLDDGESPWPVVVNEGGTFNGGFLSQGMHHFVIAADGAAAIFSADGSIVGGANNRLYLFGTLDALQGRFTSFPFTPPSGEEHVSAINLIRAGGSIEVLSCADATHCTPVSPPLAQGDTFDGDFPFVPSDSQFQSPSSSGAGYGYRLVPTASLPDPPVNSVLQAIVPQATVNPPLNYIAAPIYVLPEGYVVAEFN